LFGKHVKTDGNNSEYKIFLVTNKHVIGLIADKGYDSEFIREKARSKNMIPIIPKRSNTKNPDENFDKHLYRGRHVIENLFAKLKVYKSIAMRADKLARNFKAVVTIACTFLWLKLLATL
jgi:transposase